MIVSYSHRHIRQRTSRPYARELQPITAGLETEGNVDSLSSSTFISPNRGVEAIRKLLTSKTTFRLFARSK